MNILFTCLFLRCFFFTLPIKDSKQPSAEGRTAQVAQADTPLLTQQKSRMVRALALSQEWKTDPVQFKWVSKKRGLVQEGLKGGFS